MRVAPPGARDVSLRRRAGQCAVGPPLSSVRAQSGIKTETECGGRCCLHARWAARRVRLKVHLSPHRRTTPTDPRPHPRLRPPIDLQPRVRPSELLRGMPLLHALTACLLAKRCGVSICQRCGSAPGCATSTPAFSRYVFPPSSDLTTAAMPGSSASRLQWQTSCLRPRPAGSPEASISG